MPGKQVASHALPSHTSAAQCELSLDLVQAGGGVRFNVLFALTALQPWSFSRQKSPENCIRSFVIFQKCCVLGYYFQWTLFNKLRVRAILLLITLRFRLQSSFWIHGPLPYLFWKLPEVWNLPKSWRSRLFWPTGLVFDGFGNISYPTIQFNNGS